ncbi:S-layer homology domain-containing protein, partial [Demequina activiva]|uniref:S-layer homology domain-containing protein n=1 Tax=Demequina activiva TaxID=1582364 RepID=UPI0019436BEF
MHANTRVSLTAALTSVAMLVALMLTTMVAAPARAATSFADVSSGHVFAKHIQWLADSGVTSGYANGTFGPSDAVTRGQMAAFLYKLVGSPEQSLPATPTFSDVPRSHVFAR